MAASLANHFILERAERIYQPVSSRTWPRARATSTSIRYSHRWQPFSRLSHQTTVVRLKTERAADAGAFEEGRRQSHQTLRLIQAASCANQTEAPRGACLTTCRCFATSGD